MHCAVCALRCVNTSNISLLSSKFWRRQRESSRLCGIIYLRAERISCACNITLDWIYGRPWFTMDRPCRCRNMLLHKPAFTVTHGVTLAMTNIYGIITSDYASFSSERELFAICYRSSVCLSVCNVRAPYLAGWNFQQFFFTFWYLGHPLTFTENYTEIVPGEPLLWGV